MDDVSTIDFLSISMIHNLSIRWFNGLSTQIWMTVCQVQMKNPAFFIRRNSDERERERIHHRSDGRSGSEKRKEFGIPVFSEKNILVGGEGCLRMFYFYLSGIYIYTYIARRYILFIFLNI